MRDTNQSKINIGDFGDKFKESCETSCQIKAGIAV